MAQSVSPRWTTISPSGAPSDRGRRGLEDSVGGAPCRGVPVEGPVPDGLLAFGGTAGDPAVGHETGGEARGSGLAGAAVAVGGVRGPAVGAGRAGASGQSRSNVATAVAAADWPGDTGIGA